jgi:signal transduction histidine kinase
MTVGQRLFLSVVPAILGVCTVAGLAYWGQYERQVPHVLVITAVVASVASLGMTWMNARYLARRIQRLVTTIPALGTGASTRVALRALGIRDVADAVTGRAIATDKHDELDSIEQSVTHLSEAAVRAEETGAQRAATADRRLREYASLLAAATLALTKQLDEVRLPLHILLDNRFGDLNENQEEMLGAARAAAESADATVRRLREIVELDRGAVSLRRDAVPAGDLIASLLPGLNADCEEAGVRVTTDLAPALPRVTGDRARLQEACGMLLADRVRAMPSGSTVTITAAPSAEGNAVQIDVTHQGTADDGGADAALARRLIAANGGQVQEAPGRTTITLPTQAKPPGLSAASASAATPAPAAPPAPPDASPQRKN